MRFELSLFTRLPEKQPLSKLFIDPVATGLRWGHVLPGGFGACQVTLPPSDGWDVARQLARMTDQVDGRAHLEITAAGHTCYEGRISGLGWVGGQALSITAGGYGVGGLDDREIRSTDATAVLRGELIRQILVTYATGITAGSGDDWQEPGISHALSEFDGMRARQAIDQLLREGGPSGALSDFGVEEGQRAFLRARLAPARADYRVTLDADVQTDVDYTAIWNDVAVTYEDRADDTVKTTARVTDMASRARYGHRDITLQGGRMTQAGAELFRDTFLEVHRIPLYRARITRRWRNDGLMQDARGLETPDGGEVPPWLVRAGRWVEIPSLDPDEPVRLIITSVNYDAGSGVMDVQINGGIPDENMIFANVESVARAVVYRINPLTGARER